MTCATRLLVTLDVERDYRADWRTRALQFASVTVALPQRLHPLLQQLGVRPTYLLGGEVLLDRACVAALRALPDCELGAHLHPEYVAPHARAGVDAQDLVIDGMQGDLPSDLEAQKLATLTQLFHQQIGQRPTAFRAGRFGAGPHTGRLLGELGYTVDSSVTPGIAWRNPAGELRPDYRALAHRPWRTEPGGNLWSRGAGALLEVPVTIVSPAVLGRAGTEPLWLRPWYSDRATLLAILDAAARDEDAGAPWQSLCVMFHSMELVAGASPYPQTDADVDRFLDDLAAVCARARALGFVSATLSEFERTWTAREAQPKAHPIDVSAWTDGAALASNWQVTLDGHDAAPVLERHAVQPWFLYSLRHRAERWDNALAYDWVRRQVPTDGAVLDVGCGPGFNLHWLYERGLRALFGCDIDGKAIAAGRQLSAHTGRQLQLWVDDGRTLAGAPQRPFAALCAMNWIQLVPDFDLEAFLQRARALLADDGALVFDYIDRAFERDARHRWLTADWNKPEAERRPSEYATRFVPQQLTRALQRAGFAVVERLHCDGPVPRGVVACRRSLGPDNRPAAVLPRATAPDRRRVLYVIDSPGWALERKAQNLARCLQDRFASTVLLQGAVTESELDDADLIVLFYWRQLQSMPHLAAAMARNRHKLLLGICSHNELEGELRAPGLSLLRRLPRAVFTHSQLLEAEFRLHVGGAPWCLPNGVDSAFFSPASPVRPARAGTLRVGWTGSRDNFGADMRGLPNVLEPAIAHLPGVEFAIAAREDRLRTAEEMRAFYRSLDVYVCASRVEGTPNPCLEAAACGVPVVTTAVGNMPQLIRNGENGLLVERTPAAFAVALTQLRDAPALRLTMGRALRADIERDWDWRTRAEGFAALFAAVLSPTASPSERLHVPPIAAPA